MHTESAAADCGDPPENLGPALNPGNTNGKSAKNQVQHACPPYPLPFKPKPSVLGTPPKPYPPPSAPVKLNGGSSNERKMQRPRAPDPLVCLPKESQQIIEIRLNLYALPRVREIQTMEARTKKNVQRARPLNLLAYIPKRRRQW